MSATIFARLSNVTAFATGSFAIGGGVLGGYTFYKASDDRRIVENIGTTFVGTFLGSLIGAGIGVTWPIGITVCTARIFSDMQNKKPE